MASTATGNPAQIGLMEEARAIHIPELPPINAPPGWTTERGSNPIAPPTFRRFTYNCSVLDMFIPGFGRTRQVGVYCLPFWPEMEEIIPLVDRYLGPTNGFQVEEEEILGGAFGEPSPKMIVCMHRVDEPNPTREQSMILLKAVDERRHPPRFSVSAEGYRTLISYIPSPAGWLRFPNFEHGLSFAKPPVVIMRAEFVVKGTLFRHYSFTNQSKTMVSEREALALIRELDGRAVFGAKFTRLTKTGRPMLLVEVAVPGVVPAPEVPRDELSKGRQKRVWEA